jgi:hypothetical protein
MSTTNTLASKTSQILRDLLIRERNHHPSEAQWKALDWIAQHLAGMADGTGPQKFFLSSLLAPQRPSERLGFLEIDPGLVAMLGKKV